MKIAVYGASGYTGRLVLAELRRRELDFVVCGRSPSRLAAAAGPGAEIRVAATDDPAALQAAFADCDVVINCAGPFTFHGEPVVRAAIAAGCHYADTTGEQLFIKRIFDTCHGDAVAAGVTVVCAMGFDIVPGDLLAHLTGTRVEPVERLTLAYGTDGFGMTRGTMHSTLEILTGGDVTYRDGEWVGTGLRAGRGAMEYPGEGRVTMMKFPGGEAITVPRHVRVRTVDVIARADALAPPVVAPLVPAVSPLLTLLLRTPLRGALDRVVDRLPEGPAEDARRAARFNLVADAVGEDGRTARGVLHGSDIYGTTAVTIVEGARRLASDGAPSGVLAPAQAFDAADLLGFLGEYGITWEIEETEARPRPLDEMPGPLGLPRVARVPVVGRVSHLMAQIVEFRRFFMHQYGWFQRNCARYGSAYAFDLPTTGRGAVFASPAAAEQVLKLPPTIARGGEANSWIVEHSLGAGSLLALDDDHHLRVRKLILPPLHGERMQRWEDLIELQTLREIETWPIGEAFALRPITEHITMTVISRIVFGVRDPARAAELRELLPKLIELDVPLAVGLVSKYGRLDLGPWSPWGAYLRLQGRVDELIYAEIAERRRELQSAGDADSDARNDLMSILLQARDEDGNAMTDLELRDQLVSMLIAGHETTATSIAWAIERLVRTPAVLDRLLASLDAGETDYLDAVIKETLRIRPVVAQFARLIKDEVVIDGWQIPAGTLVLVPMAVLHHDPDLFEDPQEFRPERFLHGDGPESYAWLPFGGGVRRCPGASLAHLEMRTVLSTILRHVRLAADRQQDELPAALGATVVPARGARIVVTGHRTSTAAPAATPQEAVA